MTPACAALANDDRVSCSPARTVLALVVSNLEFGGAERQVVALANSLSRDEFDVHIFSLSSYMPLANRLQRHVALHTVEKKHKYDIGIVMRLASELRAIRADVVHTFLFDAEIAGRLAGSLARVPVIVGSERNSDYRMPARKRVVYRLTANAMDVCIANSRTGAAFNGRLHNLPPSRYRVVYNGVDVDTFHPRDPGPVRSRIGVQPHAYCVGIFGSFKPQKNHPLFFTVAKRLADESRDTTFLVVGDSLESGRRGSDEHKQRVAEMVRTLGLESRCIFLGNRDDVDDLYCACDVTVLPSLHEGTPNVALESMSSAVPVVATDVSDNRLLIPDGVVGYVVPPNDADLMAKRLLELRSRPDERRRMGQAGRRRVQDNFSMTRLATETANVYRELVESKQSCRA